MKNRYINCFENFDKTYLLVGVIVANNVVLFLLRRQCSDYTETSLIDSQITENDGPSRKCRLS